MRRLSDRTLSLSRRRVAPALLAGLSLLGACVGVAPPKDSVPAPDNDIRQIEGHQGQGHQGQGTQVWGSNASILGFNYVGWLLGGRRIVNVRVENGELVAGARPTTITQSLTPCASDTLGQARDCGWRAVSIGFCSPGHSIRLGADAACGVGSCSNPSTAPFAVNDSMLRVCAGSGSCEYAAAIASNDDACGTWCSEIPAFTCPASGEFTVLAGNYHSAQFISVNLVASDNGVGSVSLNRIYRGTELAGATFTGALTDGTTASYRIDSITTPDQLNPLPDTTGGTFGYTVSQSTGGGGYAPLCQTPVNISGVPQSDLSAVPFAAVWDLGQGTATGGSRSLSSTRFTLGCQVGVLRKCYKWGYMPWLAGGAMATDHQTCTRLARADYCGDGTSHTVDGTLVDVWDDLQPPVQSQDPAGDKASGLTFEGAWLDETQTGGIAGVACLSHQRWANQPPICSIVKSPYICAQGTPTCTLALIRKHIDCVGVCDTDSDARALFGNAAVPLYNASNINGVPDGGVPPDGYCGP
jgi:hypothetical protein